ncbi:POK6 protein, partial [Drymodes brunneopygia]|nr:POK6 protein [Drymodes brunneopygia]
LTLPAQVVPHRFSQAKMSHSFFHQIAAALARTFTLLSRQASSIVAAFPDCQRHSFPSLAGGVNPRGLQSLEIEIWQTDVMHFPEFGRLKYI